MTLKETYKGIEIFRVADMVGGYYYFAPKLTTKKCPVNFSPTVRLMKEFINEEMEEVLKSTKQCQDK